MDDLAYNYMALLEVILSDEEILPDMVLNKYGLLQLTQREIRRLEALEMIRLYKENLTLKEIGERFHMSDSGVYRRIQRWI